MWLGLFAGLCAFALPASPAFGEGSVDLNTGPGGLERHGLTVAAPTNLDPRTALEVYAQAGETIQMANSLMGFAGANILVFAPGDNPSTATPLLDCAVSQAGTGRIASRAEELAGPLPNAGGYDTCDFTVPADGIYSVFQIASQQLNGAPGTVDAPNTTVTQGNNASMWDVTVRDAAGAAQDGRVFKTQLNLRTAFQEASGVEVFAYTKTGYEYDVNFFNHAGGNWVLRANDEGVVDSATGERTFASFACGEDDGTAQCTHFEAEVAPAQYPLFFNSVDPLVISGPGGLGETQGFSDTPISPASEPIENLRFRGSAGANQTGQGFGGTIRFNTPSQMEGLGYTVEIDMNRDGVFGNNADIVDDTGDLVGEGANAYDWNGRNANGEVPPCGVYRYQVRSTLAEVHFPMIDVETSAGGTQIERLTLPNDPTLGHPLAASYDNRDPYKNGYVVTNGTPSFAFDQISGPGFNAWTVDPNIPGGTTGSGNTDYIDTWTRLPEVADTGRFRIKCARIVVKKKAGRDEARPGGVIPYKIVVRNKGEGIAQPVRVCDRARSGLTIIRAPGASRVTKKKACWRFPRLDPGDKRTFRVIGRVATNPSARSCAGGDGVKNVATARTRGSRDRDAECVPVRPPTGPCKPIAGASAQSDGGRPGWRVTARC